RGVVDRPRRSVDLPRHGRSIPRLRAEFHALPMGSTTRFHHDPPRTADPLAGPTRIVAGRVGNDAHEQVTERLLNDPVVAGRPDALTNDGAPPDVARRSRPTEGTTPRPFPVARGSGNSDSPRLGSARGRDTGWHDGARCLVPQNDRRCGV